MSSDTARALGAAQGTIKFKEVDYPVRPLSLVEIGTVQNECLKQARLRFLQTYKDAEEAGILPAGTVLQKADEASQWDVTDLPYKEVYLESELVVNDKVVQWLEQEMRFRIEPKKEGEKEDTHLRRRRSVARRVTAAALDAEILSVEAYTQMTGQAPKKAKTGYANWWITGCMDGMVAFIWALLKDHGITQDEVRREMSKDFASTATIARELEAVTAPAMGNG